MMTGMAKILPMTAMRGDSFLYVVLVPGLLRCFLRFGETL